MYHDPLVAGKVAIPEMLPTLLAIIGIVVLGFISFFNSLNGVADDTATQAIEKEKVSGAGLPTLGQPRFSTMSMDRASMM